ncbi:MAG TPA: NAD(P)/FAD-dependent oxidoreductase [Vicinamibacterales bacterium]|nr:NAD(P)/FAD-dependent oxidoreductase [Vicinamibacterales bacterium]
MSTYDVVIVGGGPAGLSAALMLGRCRRRVLVCDAGEPRNGASRHLHGYLTRDGVDPWEFRRIGREDLRQYGTVEVRDVRVVDAWCEASRFHTVLETGERVQSRKLLIATGVNDCIPDIPGLRELYGRSVFHCPYCDGWEVSDTPIAIYGPGEKGAGLALELTAWSRDLVLLTDGPSGLDAIDADRLQRNGIVVREERVARLEGRHGVLDLIVFENGDSVQRRAMFFTTGQLQQSNLAMKLGCELNEKGTVSTGKHESTHLPGLYVAGDASRAIQWVVVAAAEGAEAAFSINQALVKEDLQ